jgi:hypothetical protein
VRCGPVHQRGGQGAGRGRRAVFGERVSRGLTGMLSIPASTTDAERRPTPRNVRPAGQYSFLMTK